MLTPTCDSRSHGSKPARLFLTKMRFAGLSTRSKRGGYEKSLPDRWLLWYFSHGVWGGTGATGGREDVYGNSQGKPCPATGAWRLFTHAWRQGAPGWSGACRSVDPASVAPPVWPPWPCPHHWPPTESDFAGLIWTVKPVPVSGSSLNCLMAAYDSFAILRPGGESGPLRLHESVDPNRPPDQMIHIPGSPLACLGNVGTAGVVGGIVGEVGIAACIEREARR